MLKKALFVIALCFSLYCLFLVVEHALVYYLVRGWKIHTDNRGRYKFAYPRDWVVTKCGNGESIIGNKPVNKCYTPVDAPQEYLDNLHMQVFLPRKGLILYNYYNRGEVPPTRLNAWETVVWVKKDSLFPVIPIGLARTKSVRPVLSLAVPVENETIPPRERNDVYHSGEFRVGFIARPAYSDIYGEMIKSFRFF